MSGAGESVTRRWWRHLDRVAFRCPGCEMVHEVIVAGRGAWHWNASDDALTLAPSVLVRWKTPEPKVCHSFVRDGRIEFLGDCTHVLANRTVLLPPFADPYHLSRPASA